MSRPKKKDYKEQFEENIDFINEEILKRKPKWNLTAINWMDFDDVSNIIRAHIYKKWHLYNPEKSLGPWLNRLISNQIKNLIRNNYTNYAKPCIRCAAAEDNTGCDIYEAQGEDCPLYREWARTKKSAYDIKLAPPISSSQSVKSQESQHFDYETNIKIFNEKIKEILKPHEYKIYYLLFIENKTEVEVAKEMGYKTNEQGRNPGYKQIKNVQKRIITKAKKLLEKGEIDIYE